MAVPLNIPQCCPWFQEGSCEWLCQVLQPLLVHIYQRSLLETEPDILSTVTRVWGRVLTQAPPLALVTAATPYMGVWLCLAMQPSKLPYDNSYIVEAKHPGRVSGSG